MDIDTRDAGPVISPLLFGHNIEVTRRGLWRGLSAEMIANRKFAAIENGLPKHWNAIGDGTILRSDCTAAFAGKHSASLEVPANELSCGIAQTHETLVFHKDTRYAVRAWMKSDTSRWVQMRVVDPPAKHVLFRTDWSLAAGDWQLLGASFTVPASATNCRIEFVSSKPGTFNLGAVSAQPADTFHGLRRDVIKQLKAMKPGCIRFPGGCYAEFYKWQDGLLNVDKRPPIGPTGLSILLPDTDDYDTHEIGTDEFVAMCRVIGAEPAITVRLSDTTPEAAAAWVQYCNGGTDTKWGKIRAGRGIVKPHGVKYWYLGNELYYFGRGDVSTPSGCAHQSRLFAEAMKQADPSIRLIACTNFVGGGDNLDWNRPLVETCGKLVDLCSVHDYAQGKFPIKTDADIAQVIRAPTGYVLDMMRTARSLIDAGTDGGTRTTIAFDEWNTNWGQKGSVVMGLYAAGVLNMLCRESHALGIEQACFFMPLNEGAIKVTTDTAVLDCAGLVFRLYRAHQGNRLLKITGASPDGDIDACASLTADRKQVQVTAVNRNINAGQWLDLQLTGFEGVLKSLVKILVPPRIDKDAAEFEVVETGYPIQDDGRLSVNLPPGAIARVTFGQDPESRETIIRWSEI